MLEPYDSNIEEHYIEFLKAVLKFYHITSINQLYYLSLNPYTDHKPIMDYVKVNIDEDLYIGYNEDVLIFKGVKIKFNDIINKETLEQL